MPAVLPSPRGACTPGITPRLFQTRHKPSGNVAKRLHEMNRLFAKLIQSKSPDLPDPYPHVNVSEDEEHLILRAEVPGVGPDEIEVSVGTETVTIRAETKVEAAEGGDFYRRERNPGRFERTVNLPFRVDPEPATASLKNGILKIVLSRAKEVEPIRVKITAE